MTATNAVARRPSNAPATSERKDARDQLRAELQRYAPSFAKVLPKHLTPDRLVTLALVAATTTPKLFECSPESIALSLMKISQWGLEIGRTAHLVPFYNTDAKALQCQAIPDWKGLAELVIRSRHVKDIYARAVFEGEHFSVNYGTDERIEHRPDFAIRDPKVTHVYAVAKLGEYRATFEVMSIAQIEKIRQAAPSKDSPAWRNHYPEMAKKTVLKRLCKRLPQTPALEEALAADDQVDAPPARIAHTDDPYQLGASALPARSDDSRDVGNAGEQPSISEREEEASTQATTPAPAKTSAKASAEQEKEVLRLVEHASIEQATRSKIKGHVLRGLSVDEAQQYIDDLTYRTGGVTRDVKRDEFPG